MKMAEESTDSEIEAEVVEDLVENDDNLRQSAADLEELNRRCSAANIEVRTRKYEEDEGLTYTSIALPSGREKRWVGATGDRLPRLLNVPFEKFVFLQGYEAVCCYEAGFIEAGIRGVPLSPMIAMRRLLQSTGNQDDGEEFILAPPPEEAGSRPTYRLGNASPEFAALSQMPGGIRRFTLRLEGITVSTHDQAVAILLKYANSFLFQADLMFNASYMLERERVRRFRAPLRRRDSFEVRYPNVEYDNAPLSLYWYARSARGMPLLQFLAFYQCIEFYFPTFSQAEARRKIGLLLKDPTFRADRDSDVAKLLQAIFVSRSGGVGDERTQLRATINECLSAEEVRAFFEDDEDLKAYFSAKPKTGGVHRIPLGNATADLRNDVADRIYNIRCRIVHTKDGEQHGSGGGAMILPFSEEADFLIFDIELAQFVARKVLIATSSLLS